MYQHRSKVNISSLADLAQLRLPSTGTLPLGGQYKIHFDPMEAILFSKVGVKLAGGDLYSFLSWVFLGGIDMFVFIFYDGS